MKKIIFLVVFLQILYFQYGKVAKAGNYYADTVRIELKNNSMIELCGEDLTKHFPDKFEINKKLSEILNNWHKLKMENLSPNKKMLIRYDEDTCEPKIIISEQNSTEFYIFANKDSIVLSPPKGHILEFNVKNVKVRIFFLDFSQLEEIELIDTELVFSELKKEIPASIKFGPKNLPINKWYKLNGNNTLFPLYEICAPRSRTGNDAIQLTAGTNIQNLKGVWAGSFNAKIALAFGRKMVLKNKYSIKSEWIYDFSSNEQGFQKHVNQFVGLGYDHNFSNDPKNNSWYGISASYLLKRNGEFFNKNTFNIGLSRALNNHIEIQPMIYFNDFFKNAYPSLNIGISF
ncbi:MAG TPA: hypothetical protein VFC41_07200 [Anaerovoracaceae bacterium]|nr:hypothetical protein [Anaerovoracaceae bacterium]